MTVEEKNLLLKDLCARLPYGVICQVSFGEDDIFIESLESVRPTKTFNQIETSESVASIENVKPYLRPMDSMTEDELAEFVWLDNKVAEMPTFEYVAIGNYRILDWLNRKHFDYRGLIEKGIALEAPEGMYDCIKVL